MDIHSVLTVVISGNGMIIFYFIKIQYFIKIFTFAYLDFFFAGAGVAFHMACRMLVQ